jgi:hypothetical protein
MSYSQIYVHGSKIKPKILPNKTVVSPEDLDRVSRVTLGFTRPNEKGYELGRDNELYREWKTTEVSGAIVMNEYGNIKPFALFANQDPAVATEISLEDIKDEKFDFVTMMKDNAGAGTIVTQYCPGCYINSFTMNVGDPESKLENTWNFVGDKHLTLKGNEKYVIVYEHTLSVGEAAAKQFDIATDYPAPTENPDSAGMYLLKAVQIVGSTETELTESTSAPSAANEIQRSASKTIKIYNTLSAGNKIVLHYTAATDSTPNQWQALDNSSANYIKAEFCEVYLYDGATPVGRIYRLQSASIAGTIERTNYGEIGNSEYIARSADTVNVVITLGDLVSDASLDEYLRNKTADGTYTRIDVEKYLETLDFVIKIYAEKEHTTFLANYLVRNIKVTGGSQEDAANAALTSGRTLESDNMIYSTVEYIS